MARHPRYDLPGQPQHVIQRGNNRAAIFVAPADYVCFRAYLQAACLRHGCLVHAYVLMTNHVHLLVTPTARAAIGRVMQSVGRRYVQPFNRRYGRTGTLWEGRYKAVPIDTERYLLACYRYIERNPVRAGMVGGPAEYRWSSYRANACGAHDPLVTPHDVYTRIADSDRARHEAYRAMCAVELETSSALALRRATETGWAFGSTRFRDAIERSTGRRAAPLPRGRSASRR
jgi:putative transposase